LSLMQIEMHHNARSRRSACCAKAANAFSNTTRNATSLGLERK
jgi:hypothetical protein